MDDYESMFRELATDVANEHRKSGRSIREILAAMRDESYIECTDEELERCAKLAEEPVSNGNNDGDRT
jgi:hypothetical protein